MTNYHLSFIFLEYHTWYIHPYIQTSLIYIILDISQYLSISSHISPTHTSTHHIAIKISNVFPIFHITPYMHVVITTHNRAHTSSVWKYNSMYDILLRLDYTTPGIPSYLPSYNQGHTFHVFWVITIDTRHHIIFLFLLLLRLSNFAIVFA